MSKSSVCVLCKRQSGITSCDGCHKKLCFECFNQHRNELSYELDDLINRRNELVQMINNNSSNNTTDICSCINDINQWQNEMHSNIDRIASTVRDYVRQLLSDTNKNVRVELDQISGDLQEKQKTGGYVEDDIYRIKQQLTKLEDTIKQFNEQIQIDTSISKSIDWDTLLFIKQNTKSQINTKANIIKPNIESHINTKPVNIPPNPFLHNSLNQGSTRRMSMLDQQSHLNNSPSLSTNYSNGTQRPTGRSASVSINSRYGSYTCVCCKTVNRYNDYGQNRCTVCGSLNQF